MLLRGCMVSRAKSRSSMHLVWMNSATLSFILRRVSFSVSVEIRPAAALSSSAGLMAFNFSSAACSARCFSACLASHSALRLASASSCARRESSSFSVSGSAAGALTAAAGTGSASGKITAVGSTGFFFVISISSSSIKALETAASLF